jgi:hypothetical protein
MLVPALGVADLFMAASLLVGLLPFVRIRADAHASAPRLTKALSVAG